MFCNASGWMASPSVGLVTTEGTWAKTHPPMKHGSFGGGESVLTPLGILTMDLAASAAAVAWHWSHKTLKQRGRCESREYVASLGGMVKLLQSPLVENSGLNPLTIVMSIARTKQPAIQYTEKLLLHAKRLQKLKAGKCCIRNTWETFPRNTLTK